MKQLTIRQVVQKRSKWETKYFAEVEERQIINDLKKISCPLKIENYKDEYHIVRIEVTTLKNFDRKNFCAGWFCRDLGFSVVSIKSKVKKLGGVIRTYPEERSFYLDNMFVFYSEENANKFIQWYEQNIISKVQFLLTIHKGL